MFWAILATSVIASTAFAPHYLYPGNAPTPDEASQYEVPNRPLTSIEDSLDAGAYLHAPQMDVEVIEDECEALPNRTKTRPAFYQCSQDTVLTLHGGAITNLTGDDTYPISFAEPIRIFLDVTSTANRRFDNIAVDVSLYKRTSSWFGCGWMFLPSFGQLSNSDMCDDNPSCPISPGRQVIEFAVDPTRLFTRLFRIIHDDMIGYQLVIRLVDNRRPYEDLLCATAQMRIRL
ncbi:unnamed protein product [Auanema sp. JU1783]|nr:unnamed protein product [Auanema sp. JU1783]